MENPLARGSGGKLERGVRVILFDPKWNRPCSLCIKYVFGEDGRIRLGLQGEPLDRGAAPTPCYSCAKVPGWAKSDGSRDHVALQKLAVDMAPENRRAFDRYKEFRATGRFPDDALVNWYAGIIGPLYEEWERQPLRDSTATTVALLTLLVKARR